MVGKGQILSWLTRPGQAVVQAIQAPPKSYVCAAFAGKPIESCGCDGQFPCLRAPDGEVRDKAVAAFLAAGHRVPDAIGTTVSSTRHRRQQENMAVMLRQEGWTVTPPSPCISCGEGSAEGDAWVARRINRPVECEKSQRGCGHHCNHSWTHDRCCWCLQTFGEVDG